MSVRAPIVLAFIINSFGVHMFRSHLGSAGHSVWGKNGGPPILSTVIFSLAVVVHLHHSCFYSRRLREINRWLQFSLVFIGSLLLLELSHHFVWFPLERIPYVRMKQFASLLHYNSFKTTGDMAGWVAAHAPLFSYLMSVTFLGFILYAHRLVGPGFTFPKISSFFIPRGHSKRPREAVEKTCPTEDSRATSPCSSKRTAYRSKSMLDRVPNRPSTSCSSRC